MQTPIEGQKPNWDKKWIVNVMIKELVFYLQLTG